MYEREISKLPIKISRDDFVKEIFELGYINNEEYGTMMLAVEIGDFFEHDVDFAGLLTGGDHADQHGRKHGIFPQ